MSKLKRSWWLAVGSLLLAASAAAAPSANEAKPVQPAGASPPVAEPKPRTATGGKAAMRARCLAAVAESGKPSAAKPAAENAYDAGPGNYLFEFKQPEGGSFFCQICDDSATECLNLGLELSFRPAQGEQERLPAELDRKCVYFLQKEVTKKHRGTMKIDQEIVDRVQVTATHTDARFVYRMALDKAEYRCVIRKSDGNFLVERQQGSEWRPIAAGLMF